MAMPPKRPRRRARRVRASSARWGRFGLRELTRTDAQDRPPRSDRCARVGPPYRGTTAPQRISLINLRASSARWLVAPLARPESECDVTSGVLAEGHPCRYPPFVEQPLHRVAQLLRGEVLRQAMPNRP